MTICRPSASRWKIALTYFVIAGGAVAISLPTVLAFTLLSNDAVGYIATARNWVEGRGLVDPILYSYYLPGAHPPLPAILIRPPMVSVLLALPLYLGAGLTGLGVAHVVFASLIGASGLLLGSRIMSLPAAAACAIAVAWSPSWRWASTSLLTEATTVGVLFLFCAISHRGIETRRDALILGALSLLAWLTRPNLAVLVPVVVLATLLDRGVRETVRDGPLWLFVGSFLIAYGAVTVGITHGYGFGPYEHYGIMAETLSFSQVPLYRTDYLGMLSFASRHASELLSVAETNLGIFRVFAFERPFYLYVGWLAAPGIFHALLRRGPGSFTRRLMGLAAIFLTVVALATSWGFDPTRYPLPGVVCAWFVIFGLLDDGIASVLTHLTRRFSWAMDPRVRSVAHGVPLLLTLVTIGVQVAPVEIASGKKALGSYQRHGTQPVLQDPRTTPAIRSFCMNMHPDSLVASPNPWSVLYWCGNAGYLVATDLDDLGWLDRYIEDKSPGYLISDGRPEFAAFVQAPGLDRIASHGGYVLFRVRDAGPASRPWTAPFPLSSLD